MKVYILSLLSVLSLAEIRTISDLSDVIPMVDEGTLVFFDLDDTLIIPNQFIGHDFWVNQFVKELSEKGEDIEKAFKLWGTVRLMSGVKPSQSNAVAIVSEIQDKAMHVMALTAQSSFLIEHTSTQLESIGFHMKRNIPSSIENFAHNLSHDKLGGFVNGVIFSSGAEKKGEIANEVIDKYITKARMGDVNYPIKRIIMVDDNANNLAKIQNFLEIAKFATQDTFIGYHYVRDDLAKDLEQFPREFGDVQLKMSNFLEGLKTDDEVWKALGKKGTHPNDYSSFVLKDADADAEENFTLRF